MRHRPHAPCGSRSGSVRKAVARQATIVTEPRVRGIPQRPRLPKTAHEIPETAKSREALVMRTGGRILIDQLVGEGCRTLFTVPGESFIAALDALFDAASIRTIVCRHEGGAAMMAEATGKLTGQPGVAFVTRAPGATNAASGVYVAHHDATAHGPPRRADRACQRGTRRLPGNRPAGHVRRGAELGRRRARSRAHPGVRGARLQGGTLRAARARWCLACRRMCCSPTPKLPTQPRHSLTALAPSSSADDAPQSQAIALPSGRCCCSAAAGWSAEAAAHIAKFAEAFDMPVATAFRRQDHLDNRHPSLRRPRRHRHRSEACGGHPQRRPAGRRRRRPRAT